MWLMSKIILTPCKIREGVDEMSWVNCSCRTYDQTTDVWQGAVLPSRRWAIAKGGSETQNGRFPSNIALYMKQVCYKVSLCVYCQRRGCTTVTDLSNCAKMVNGGRRLLPDILAKSGPRYSPFQKCRFCINWSVMPQMSTSVKQTTEVVALMPAAVTMWAAPRAPVDLDLPEMDSPAQVNHHHHHHHHHHHVVITSFLPSHLVP